jgi:hypothetical protein
MTQQRTEESYDEDEEYSITLSNVVLPSGEEMFSQIDCLDSEDILTEMPFDRDADSEDEGEFTGNEGMPNTYRYHDAVWHLIAF